MVDVLIPLTRFEVRYEVASGRPYADLEKLVLNGICDGINKIEALVQTFQLKPRIIIEVIITLARAGWVAIEISTGTFSATRLGIRAATGRTLPPFTMVAATFDIVILEAWTGLMIAQREINVTNTFALRATRVWDSAIRLPAKIPDDRIDHGEIINSLRREEEQWIRSIETPTMIARGRHWLRVRVDFEQDTVFDLPARWEGSLSPMLLDYIAAATNTPRHLRSVRTPVAEDEDALVNAEVRACDVFTTHEQHLSQVRDALTHAQSIVFIASAFLDVSVLDGEFRDLVVAALRRGVQIHLLWGYSMSSDNNSGKATIKKLREIRKEVGTLGGNLRFSAESTESHAKIILADPRGELVGIVGSFEWLSTPLQSNVKDDHDSNVSIRLREPTILSQLFHIAAALWITNKSGLLSDAPDRLRHLAAQCGQEAVTRQQQCQTPNVRVRLIRDIEHEHVLRRFLRRENENRLIVSHQLGWVATARLQNIPLAEKAPLTFLYGRRSATMTPESEEKLFNTITNGGGRFVKEPHLHAKICIAGSSAVISSYNFLSADAFQTAQRTRELGVLIVGENIADHIRTIFSAMGK